MELVPEGNYAIRIVFDDLHDTGIYSWRYLREIGENRDTLWAAYLAALDGPVGPFRSYREEWTEHFALCFEELEVKGDAAAAHGRSEERSRGKDGVRKVRSGWSPDDLKKKNN